MIVGLLGAQPVMAGGCPAGTSTPASFRGTVAPARAVDINPDPRIVEVDLTAAETVWPIRSGTLTSVYAYNGTLPGPTIEANLGDRLIVNFCNDLPVDTTVHWHGVETPANMDGSDMAQLKVPPGGTFRYDFPLLEAGTFWFHPHVRTYRQVERGLYGVLVVRDPAEDAALGLPTGEHEHILVLDDIHLDAANQIIEPFQGDRTAIALEQLNGREGDTQLLNGVVQPHLEIERQVPHRLRLLNAASSRFLRLSIPEHLMWRIGGDQGLIERPIRSLPVAELPNPPLGDPAPEHGPSTLPDTGLLLTPGERADVLIFPQPRDNGAPLALEWHDWTRGRHSVDFLPDGNVAVGHNIPDGTLPKKIYATIELTGLSTQEAYAPPSTLANLTPHDPTTAPILPLVFGHTLPDWETGNVMFFAQDIGKPFPVLTPDDVYTLGAGQTYIWEVRNLTGSHHNFHVHGFSFQHLETELVDLDDPTNNAVIPEDFVEDKDTILLVRRPGSVPGRSWSITRLITKIEDSGREGQIYAAGKAPTATTSGGWLLHCHILEHAGRGMGTFFQVDGRLLLDGFETGDTRHWGAVVSGGG